MKSTINVYRQNNEGLTEYYVFLDLIGEEGIQCPAYDNPSGFNYAKADLIHSCDWIESEIALSEFDMDVPNRYFDDSHFTDICHKIACACLSAAANNKKVYEFIDDYIANEPSEFIGLCDAHQPQLDTHSFINYRSTL